MEEKLILNLVKILLAVLVTASRAKGQDPHFSQFFASPLTLNPAYTGKFDGNIRAAGNYRSQWTNLNQAYLTFTAAADFKLLQQNIQEGDTWGMGLMAMTDESAGGALNETYLSFTTAYHKKLDPDGLYHLGVGFQGTYAGKRLDGLRLNLGDELDGNGEWTLPSADPIYNRQVRINYWDVSVGCLLTGSTNGDNYYYTSVSIYHANRPRENFLDDGRFLLQHRITVHGGGYIPLGDRNELHLSAMHSSQAGATNTIAGGAFAIDATGAFENSNPETGPIIIYFGAWFRWKDAIVPYAGFDYQSFRLGISYDINISSLQVATERKGGLELSLIYVRQSNKNGKFLPCPKF